MAVKFAAVLVAVAVAAVAIVGWKLLNWAWLRPRKLEKQLRRQGFKGNSYSLGYGDLREMLAMEKEAQSKPISFSHDIVPRVFPFFHKMLLTHGQNFIVWVGPQPMVNITEPNLIKEILSKYGINQFHKAFGRNPRGKLLMTGVLMQEGEKWVKHRKIINPAFHIEKLKNMLPGFYLSCTEMIEKWEAVVSKKGGSCELNVWPDLQTLTADVISRNAFGSSYEEGRKIFELQKERGEFVKEVARSLIHIPGSRFMPTKTNKRMKEIERDVKETVKSIIDKRMKAMKAGEGSNDDLLGILLESNYKEIQQHGNNDSGLSIDEIIDECKLFYFAGQETTASFLVWTMILLGQHQHWQEQARNEVLHVFGNKKPDHDRLNHLKIVTMILNEALRLYPSTAALLRRITLEETKIGDITLPAGVLITMPTIMLHHNQELWGDDANEFKPERFSEGVSKVTKGKASFLPFGGGPKICVGQNFAMLEAKMTMTMILQRFSFTLSPSYSHAPHAVVTLKPQYGAHLILQKL